MQDHTDILSASIAVIGATLSWFFGSFDGAIKVLIVLVIIDFIMGVLRAGLRGELSSSVGFKGIAKKVTIFAFVGIAHVVGKEFFGDSAMLREVVIYFYAATEGFSIIENAHDLGVPIPRIIANLFDSMKEKGGEETV